MGNDISKANDSNSFTRAVDDAIRSNTPSIFGDSPVPSFGSLIDNAIRSSCASSTDADFDLLFHSLGLSGPDHFEITPPPEQQAQAQQDHGASPPHDTLNLQQPLLQTEETVNAVTPPLLPVNTDKSNSSQRGADTKNESSVPKDGPMAHMPIAAQTFTFRELAVATKNFRPEYLLGEGGFKRVYKGRLESTGQVVAIKQLDRNLLQGNRQFLVEILMLNLLRHPNLVNLIGYCADGDQRLIVYEYMPLGSLDHHLHDLSPDREPLDWNTRLKIAAGAAKGLEYLHDNANPPVIYRNFKTTNILLDEGYHPKLSDFALAKLGPVGDKTHVSTQVMGTYGYIAPEYAMSGQLSLESDVYSFGVVLLELITGRKAIDNTRALGEQSLVAWARPLFKDRSKFPKMADPLLQGRYPMRGLYQALAVAAMCLQEKVATRPPIRDVVTVLTYLASQTYNPNVANQSNRVGPSVVRIGVFYCNDGAEYEFNMDKDVYVLTICRFMLHRAAKARLIFGPCYVLCMMGPGLWICRGCHCCQMYSRTVSVVCLSLCFRLIPIKNLFSA